MLKRAAKRGAGAPAPLAPARPAASAPQPLGEPRDAASPVEAHLLYRARRRPAPCRRACADSGRHRFIPIAAPGTRVEARNPSRRPLPRRSRDRANRPPRCANRSWRSTATRRARRPRARESAPPSARPRRRSFCDPEDSRLSPPSLQPPSSEFGSTRCPERIAVGGMAEVWKARKRAREGSKTVSRRSCRRSHRQSDSSPCSSTRRKSPRS